MISVLVPVLDEEESIKPLYDSLVQVFSEANLQYEIIYVNDGSTDSSMAILDRIAASDWHVKVIHMRRNYGQTAALMAGIRASRGSIIIPMDGDLQNDPTDIPRLLAKLEEGYDVVSGWRKKREDNAATRRIPSILANILISAVFRVRLHDHGCTLKAYRRDVVENIRLYGEMHRYLPVYASWEGARVTEIPVAHHARRHGRSKYGLGRVFRVLLDVALLYFMDRAFDRPMQFFGKLGGFSLLVSFLLGVWALWMKFAQLRDLVQSPLPVLVTGFALAGVLFILLGVLAEMQMRIYFATQERLPYSIKATRNLGERSAPNRDERREARAADAAMRTRGHRRDPGE